MTKQEFIGKLAPLAIADMKKTKVLASLTLAQGALETNWGGSDVMMKANALFGIKATASWKGKVYSTKTKECYDGVSFTTITDLFRAYDSWEESVADHSALFTGVARYAAVVGETDYIKACKAVHAAGYATAPSYADTLILIIEQNKFYEYDRQKENDNMYKNHVISTQNELLTSGFKIPSRPDHYGADYIDKQDLQVTAKGVDIIAFADGKVVEVINGSLVGWTVAISHEGKILTRYQHMRNGVAVKVGDIVKKGQKLGVMGNTGSCISSRTDVPPEYRGTHLHFGVKENSTAYNNGIWVDPEPYLRGEKTIPSQSPVSSTSASPKIGDILGKVLYTDIKAYINGHAIPVSVANGKTLVVVEDLKYYGFDVAWDDPKGSRTLKVERNKNKTFKPLAIEGLPAGVKSGDVKCNYMFTDIKTYLSGELVESYCIDGVTLIDVELLGKYGKAIPFDKVKREVKIEI